MSDHLTDADRAVLDAAEALWLSHKDGCICDICQSVLARREARQREWRR